MSSDEGKKLQLVHMEKTIQYSCERAISNEEGQSRNELSFFCYGYYDKVARIYCSKPPYFSHKDLFAINYPYKKSNQPIYADQMFSLILENPSRKDPFVLNDSAPFLGIFLLTVSMEGSSEKKFSTIIKDCIDKLKKSLEEHFGDCVWEIYKTPNCADICVVLQTGKLSDIYKLKRDIKIYAIDTDQKTGINPVLTIASSFPDKLSNRCFREEIVANNNQELEIRFECCKDIQDEIEDLKKEGIRIAGTGGIGEYAMFLPFHIFSQCYSTYINIKQAVKLDPIKENDLSIIRFMKNHQYDLNFTYERWLFELERPDIANENHQEQLDDYICQSTQLLDLMIKRLEKSKELKLPVNFGIMAQPYYEQRRLIRDLLYTYNNFWYQKSSSAKGVFFYAQLEALLSGIENQAVEIEKAYNQQDCKLEVLYDDLVQSMQYIIAGINSFSKLLLTANFHIRNIPNYEMQTKVNVEKYLYAYNMFLIKICRAHNEWNMKKDINDLVFPVFYMDLSSRNVKAYTVFPKLDGTKDEEKWIRTFLIACPNYQRFSNVYHVLPMITHEISHNFRFLTKKERNEFVIRYLIREYSVQISNCLLGYQTQRNYTLSNYRERGFVEQNINDVLSEMILEKMKDEYESIHFRNMLPYVLCYVEELCCIHGQRRQNASVLWTYLGEKMEEIFRRADIEYVCPGESKDEVIIRINCAIDLLNHRETERENWKKELKVIISEEKDDTRKENYSAILKVIQSYESEVNAYLDFIELALVDMIGCFSEHFMSIFRINESDYACVENKFEDIIEVFGEKEEYVIKKIRGFVEQFEFLNTNKQQYMFDCLCILHEDFSASIDILQELRLQPHSQTNHSDQIFLKKLHKKLNDAYLEKVKECDKGILSEERWILRNSTQENYMRIGIINPNPEQFCSYYAKQALELNLETFAVDGEDYLKRYNEVCADLGMCEAFSFDCFGYYCYMTHLFMAERCVPRVRLMDMSEERIALVIKTLYAEENGTKELSQGQLGDLHVYLCGKIIEYAIAVFSKYLKLPDEEIRLIKESADDRIWTEIQYIMEKHRESRDEFRWKMHYDMLQWMITLFCNMNIKQPVALHKDIIKHFIEIREDIKKSRVFNSCSNNEAIKSIGRYYNGFVNQVDNPNREKECMEQQNNFVLTNYEECIQMCNEWRDEYLKDDIQDEIPSIIERMYTEGDKTE